MHGIISRIRSVSAQRKLQLKRKLTKERRGRYVRAVVDQLQRGRPTLFAFEATCRHAVRSRLCIEGWPWREADAAAAEVLTLALVRLGARRPTWYEGQRDVQELHGGRIFCANEECQKPIVSRSVNAMYCSEPCRKSAKGRRYLETIRVEDAAASAVWRAEARKKGETRSCEWCQRPFQALDYTGKKPQRFCGLKCRSAFASSKAAAWRPATITTWRCESGE